MLSTHSGLGKVAAVQRHAAMTASSIGERMHSGRHATSRAAGPFHQWRTAASRHSKRASEPVQAGLFPDDSVPDELVGYRGPSACQIAGITYRQLDYWARTSLVVPSIRGAAGSGSQRLYSFKDILVLKIVKRLLDTGISLQNIRVAVDHLRQRGVAGPGQHHPVLRRHHGLRVHVGRGGRRPAAGRPGRVRHRGVAARCGS